MYSCLETVRGEVSDRQWRDIIGIITVQQARIDHAYLRMAAEESDLVMLLRRVLVESE